MTVLDGPRIMRVSLSPDEPNWAVVDEKGEVVYGPEIYAKCSEEIKRLLAEGEKK